VTTSHTAPGSNPVAALRHDLRTPVNHIVGYAEMLLEDLDGPGHEARRASLEATLKAAKDVKSLQAGKAIDAEKSGWFDTHPPIALRVRLLREMAHNI